MGVFDARSEAQRSLHLLGALLSLRYPLDASLRLVARLAETRGLRTLWERVYERVFDGHSLSQALRSLHDDATFPAPVVALVEVGEVQGELPSALALLAGGDSYDFFRVRELPAAASLPPPASLEALVPKTFGAAVRQAIGAGAERVGLFCDARSTMLGPPELSPDLTEGVFVGSPAERSSIAARRALDDDLVEAPTAVHEHDDEVVPPSSRLTLGPRFDPPLSAPRAVVGVLRFEAWHELYRPPVHLFSKLVRHCLFRARIDYWTTSRREGSMAFELESARHMLPVELSPTDRHPSLVIDLRGIYR